MLSDKVYKQYYSCNNLNIMQRSDKPTGSYHQTLQFPSALQNAFQYFSFTAQNFSILFSLTAHNYLKVELELVDSETELEEKEYHTYSGG